jgi:phosphoribosylformimino-5-aminoimidazole carboxamide ribotide isomerase
MDVIPVIDVKGGVAVAARGGDRANYQPLSTPLAKGSDPLAIARGYRALYPFKAIYIADLDGIEGRGADLVLVRKLAEAVPAVSFWVDNGAAEAAAIGETLSVPRTLAVVGSETGVTPETLSTLAVRFPHRLALSLDFRGEMFLGEPRLLFERTAWPDTVIAMTLARVGSGEGPDNARLGSIAAMAGLRRVYAAGGIRNRADIDAARMAGAAGALVATALHAGKIKTGDLVEIAG